MSEVVARAEELGRFRPYPEYVNSGVEWVGRIPSEWKVRRGKFLFRNLKTLNSGRQSQNLLALTMKGVINKDIEGVGGLRPDDYATYQLFEKDDLVFKLIDLENIKTSRVGLVHEDGIMSSAYIRVTHTAGSCSKYFYYQYYSLYLQAVFNELGAGVRSTMNADDLLELPIVAPDLSEQHAIAAFLDRETAKIDALVAKKERLTELLQEKRTAFINHAVTKGLDPTVPMKPSGIDWLGEIPAHWRMRRLKFLANTTKGLAFKADIFSTDGVRVVKASDIKQKTIHTSTTYISLDEAEAFGQVKLKADDLILSTVGSKPAVKASAVGQIATVPSVLDGALLNQNTVRIEPRRSLLSSFLPHALDSRPFRVHLDSHAHGTANQVSLNVVDVLNYLVPVPPRVEQEAISRWVSDEEEELAVLEQGIRRGTNLLREFRTALISAAVTGKIDVREEASAA